MRILKRLVGLVVVVVVLLIAIAFILPRQVEVTRSVEIAAAPATVFEQVNNLKNFTAWSPWGAIDPDMEVTYSGPDAGVGSQMAWVSEDPNIGSGRQEIVLSEKDTRVDMALDFGDMGTAEAGFVLAAAGDGTRVSWGFSTDLGYNPVARWMGLMIDRWVGADYERGLAALKGVAEAQ